MDQPQTILYLSVCHWPFPNDLGSSLVHGLRSKAMFLWSKNVFSYIRYEPDKDFAIFTASDFVLAKITLGQVSDTYSGQKQYFCENKNLQCFFIKRYDQVTSFAIFLRATFWPLVNFMTHVKVKSNVCV